MKIFKTAPNRFKSKLLVLLVILLMISCDANMYIDPVDSSKTHFTPPTWIKGVWQSRESDSIHGPKYNLLEFTDGNFIGSMNEGQYRENYNRIINGSSWAYELMYEIKTDDEYEIVIGYFGTPRSHRFVRIIDNQIMYHYLHNKELSEPKTPILFERLNTSN